MTRVEYGSAEGRWVLFATVLGSSMVMLDGTVVNIALPTIGGDFDAGLTSLQWVVNAYALTLAGLLLLGGSLGDHIGRRRVFIAGVVWFALASLACAVAPSEGWLIAARAMQGVGGALLTPGSLAIIQASFEPRGRAAAVGAWSGLAGVSTAVGPILGGWLVEAASWRLIFFINLPVAALVIWVAARHVPESSDETASGEPLDLAGAALAAVGLGALTYALTLEDGGGEAIAIGAIGIAGLIAFVAREWLASHPLVPLELFRSLQFSGANAVTFVLYGALSAALFVLPIQLQVSAGFSVLGAGAAVIPMTLIMLAFSSRAGRLAERIGPRLPMAVGPVVAGLGILLLMRIEADATFLADVLPGVAVFGAGLAITVAPLTSAVLAAGGDEHVGVSSAVNNDVARVAGLLAVAVVPSAAGLSGADYLDAEAFTDGFQTAVAICGALAIAGGLVAWATIRTPAEPGPAEGASHCALDAPPLRCETRDTVLAGARDG